MEKKRLSAAQAKHISDEIIDQKKEQEIKLQLKSKHYLELADEIFSAALSGKERIKKQLKYDEYAEFSILKLLDKDFLIEAKKDGTDLKNKKKLIAETIFETYDNSELLCEKISSDILNILDLHPEYIKNNYSEFDGYLSYPEIDFDEFCHLIPYINISGYEWIIEDYFKHYDIVKNAIELDFLNWTDLTIEWQKELQKQLLLLFNNIEERNNKIKILAKDWSSIYNRLRAEPYDFHEISENNLIIFETNEDITLDVFWGDLPLDGLEESGEEAFDYLYRITDFNCSLNMQWIACEFGQKIIEEIENLVHNSCRLGLFSTQFNLLPPDDQNGYWSFFPASQKDNVILTTLTNPKMICNIFDQ